MPHAYDSENIFAKILRGEIPSNTVLETEHTLAFNDIQPQAPVPGRAPHLIVRNQNRTERDQLEGKSGFSTSRRPQNDQTPPVESDGGSMQQFHPRGSDGQADHEARAERFGGDVRVGGADVLRPDHTAMRFDDLLGDG